MRKSNSRAELLPIDAYVTQHLFGAKHLLPGRILATAQALRARTSKPFALDSGAQKPLAAAALFRRYRAEPAVNAETLQPLFRRADRRREASHDALVALLESSSLRTA